MKKGFSIIGLAFAMSAQGLGFKPQFCLDPPLQILVEDDCGPNVTGTKDVVYYCPKQDFAAIEAATTEDDATTPDQVGLIETAHTFAGTDGFTKLNVTLDKNSIRHEFVGENGNGNWVNKASIFVPGAKNEATGFMNSQVRRAGIWILETPDGVRKQIGDESRGAYMKPMWDSQTDNATDPRGWEIEISAPSSYALTYGAALAITLRTSV